MKKRFRRKNIKLWLLLVLAVLPLIAVGAFFLTAEKQKAQYKAFIDDFETASAFAQDRHMLRAEYDGVSTRISDENAGKINRTIITCSFVYYNKKTPPEDEALLLDFGTGDLLWIWPDEGGYLIIRYQSFKGGTFLYSARESVRFSNFLRLTSVEGGNSLWEE